MIKIYPFQAKLSFLCILLFLYEKYGLHVFQNDLELPSTLSFSKYCNLVCLFRFATRFRCHLNWIFWLIWIDLEMWSDLHLLPKVLIKMGFLILSKKKFFFLGVCLSKIETKLFLKTAWVLIASILLNMSNLNWSLSFCLKLRYINFSGSKFSSFVLRIVYMMVITQTNFKEICRHKWKFRICN